VESCQGFWQALLVAGQASEPIDPAEAALHDPAARKQHEAFLGLRQLDDVQFAAFV